MFRNKDEIVKMLNPEGINLEFKVPRVILNKKAVSARIKCKNLSTSCYIQCKSMLHKLPWKFYSEKKEETFSGFLRVVPNSIQNRPLAITSKKLVEDFPNEFTRLIENELVLVQILRNLKTSEIYNFYCAVDKKETVFTNAIKINLDASCPEVQNNNILNFLNKKIERYNPPKISFPQRKTLHSPKLRIKL